MQGKIPISIQYFGLIIRNIPIFLIFAHLFAHLIFGTDGDRIITVTCQNRAEIKLLSQVEDVPLLKRGIWRISGLEP